MTQAGKPALPYLNATTGPHKWGKLDDARAPWYGFCSKSSLVTGMDQARERDSRARFRPASEKDGTMSKSLYVGGLPYSTTEDGLRTLFAEVGEISSIRLIKDRDTGQSKGFAFVEMPNDAEAL